VRQISYKPYLFLLFCLFLILSLPLRFIEGVRFRLIHFFHLSWQGLTLSTAQNREELEHLELENQNLRAQIQNVRQWLLFEERLEEQLERFQLLSTHDEEADYWKEFFQRRSEYLCHLLDKQYQSLPAEVIFREPSTWNSAIWLNVGEKDNQAVGRTIIAKNSPVLVGSSLVGVVESVGPLQSRARLITDSALTPSVRAIRNNGNHRLLHEHLDALILGLEVIQEKHLAEECLEKLYKLKEQLKITLPDRYLAKGELHGSGHPLWRSRGQSLKGVGFNYDYADKEGPARALRSAKEILKVGDILVTSGLDGVFPPDLPVAIVTSITPLREGACSYDLEAEALCTHLDDLRFVYVLPPIH